MDSLLREIFDYYNLAVIVAGCGFLLLWFAARAEETLAEKSDSISQTATIKEIKRSRLLGGYKLQLSGFDFCEIEFPYQDQMITRRIRRCKKDYVGRSITVKTCGSGCDAVRERYETPYGFWLFYCIILLGIPCFAAKLPPESIPIDFCIDFIIIFAVYLVIKKKQLPYSAFIIRHRSIEWD